jgi:hypothetical protein
VHIIGAKHQVDTWRRSRRHHHPYYQTKIKDEISSIALVIHDPFAHTGA